jgi:hypothetical protein
MLGCASVRECPPSALLALVGRCAGEDGRAELFHQPKVVAVIPDLDHLAVVAEPEDVYAGEFSAPAGRSQIGPAAGVGAGSSPASGDEVVLGENEINPPIKIREGVAKCFRDSRLSCSSRSRLRGAQIVTHVAIREDLFGEADVPTCPDFLIEALDDSLVRVDVHRLQRS